MAHPAEETLALLALGEDVATEEELAHIAACPECSATLAGLRETAALGRAALALGELTPPAPRVWTAIEAELGFDRRRVRRRRRRVLVGVLAAAAVVVAAVVGVQLLRPAPTLIASASLAGLPSWPGASGEATVESSDGRVVLHVRLAARPAPARFREVWLITADQRTLVSLGVLRGASGDFTVPAGLDLARYDLVDVSSEPHDGDPAHSGDSIVRGVLQEEG